MIKSESNNTFGEGLMMDMNPLTTPNSVMTNCLNGTLITFNGNEYILQNDMGNGRVETAFLPEGFVPLGTTELGGIIYIVSYNPNTNRCQIGSFPSPERNITSDEVENSPVVSLENKDFGYQDSVTGAKVYYLKKNLNSKLTFNPGDKFIVYGDTINKNKEKIQEIDYSGKDPTEETIRLYIGTITSDGRLIVFDNLKRFKIDDAGNQYYVYQYDNNSSTGGKPDLDEYRSLVSQPYNIFNSKISGELVIIAELVQCTSFEAEVSHNFDSNKKYIPNVTFKFGGEYNYLPYGVQCKFQLIGSKINTRPEVVEFKAQTRTEFSKNFQYEETVKNILEGTSIATTLKNKYDFKKQGRDPLILTYEFTPCMNWGPIKYLTVRGQIDLAKLGTGIIELNSWKYYNTDSKCSLTWGLDVYEEEGCKVSDVEFELTRFLSEDGQKETIIYNINKKISYHGTFYEIIPFNQEYYKFDTGVLVPNNLYLVTIKVFYDRPDGQANEVRKFYRWLYTNACFNDYYYKENDYNGIKLNFDTKVQFRYNTNASSDVEEKYGILKVEVSGDETTDSTNLESKTSISVSQTIKDVTADCTAQFVLEDDYNSFNLKLYDEGANVSADIDNATLNVTSDFKYIDREDSDYKKFLANNIIENWNGTTPDLSAATPEKLIPEEDSTGKDEYGNGLYIPQSTLSATYNSDTNSYSFNLLYKLLQLTKAYCTKKKELLSYSGKFVPLCYDSDSFSNYNLVNDNGKWVPDILGIFSFRETGGDKGQGYIGSIKKESSFTKTETQYKKANNIDINFGLDADIVYHENINGWKNTTMFVAHYGTSKSNPRQEWNNSMIRNNSWISYNPDGQYGWFSVDPTYQSNSNHHLVVLMMQSSENDGRYYPINFCMTVNMYNIPINYFSSNSYYSTLYQTFAQVLNNIYRYEAESFSQNFIIPESVYYGDNYKYNVNIPVKITIEDTTKCTVEMMLQDKSLIPISKFKELIPVDAEVDSSNITATVNNVKDQDQPTLIIQDTNLSSIALRNHIMDEADINIGNIVYDFDGKTIIGAQSGNYKTSELYCREVSKSGSKVTVENTITKASTFRPVQINYDSQGKAKSVAEGSGTKLLYQNKSGTDWDNEGDSKQDLTKEFMLSQNGYLVIKTPDKLGLSFYRGGSHDTGSVTGYQRIGFGKLYKAWS